MKCVNEHAYKVFTPFKTDKNQNDYLPSKRRDCGCDVVRAALKKRKKIYEKPQLYPHNLMGNCFIM